MALVGTSRGVGGNYNTSSSTLTFSPTSNFAAGSYAVLGLSVDNSAASGTSPITSVTDSQGNTWTMHASWTWQTGTVNNGTHTRVMTSPMDGGALTTSDTITVAFSTNTPARAWTLTEVASNAGGTIAVDLYGSDAWTNQQFPQITTGSVSTGDMVVGIWGADVGSYVAVTKDTDTTRGSWSALYLHTTETFTEGQQAGVQFKVVTGDGTQQFNPVLNRQANSCVICYVTLTETVTETAEYSLTASGGGDTTLEANSQRTAEITGSTGGSATISARTATSGSLVGSGGGDAVLDGLAREARYGSLIASGGGGIGSSHYGIGSGLFPIIAGHTGSLVGSGGGDATLTTDDTPEEHEGSVLATGGGSVTLEAYRTAINSLTGSTSGDALLAGYKAVVDALSASGGGSALVVPLTDRYGLLIGTTGGDAVLDGGLLPHSALGSLIGSGGGAAEIEAITERLIDFTASGGGDLTYTKERQYSSMPVRVVEIGMNRHVVSLGMGRGTAIRLDMRNRHG